MHILALTGIAAILIVLLGIAILRFLARQLLHAPTLVRLFLLSILVAVAVAKWDLVNSNALLQFGTIAVLGLLCCKLAYEIYVSMYFRSVKFSALKKSIAHHTTDCNELNDHIEGLKSTFVDISSSDYGEGRLQDTSNFKMKRRNWNGQSKSQRVYNCSASVCKNANDQPFKYICKYFNIKIDENSLSSFEHVLNNFSAAEQGKVLLTNERDLIISRIRNSIPRLIRRFKQERVIRELGFKEIDLSELYFPVYTFQYVSAGGNSSFRSDTKLDVQTLDRFVTYLGSLITFRKSVAGQRALMTSWLREQIKIRDNYTCQVCSLSTADEKHLLLEIDHIVPLAKGGITSEENLQTLCWKCNRSKGAKLLSPSQGVNSLMELAGPLGSDVVQTSTVVRPYTPLPLRKRNSN